MRHKLWWMAALLLMATPLMAQAAPAEGDLIPRSGILMYILSDKPDTLNRLFGKDAEGNWRLPGLVSGAAGHLGEEAADIAQSVLKGMHMVSRVEIALVDVTMQGPKLLVHQFANPGQQLDAEPEYLAEYLAGKGEFMGREYLIYRPGPSEEGEEGFGALGMDRWYVHAHGGGMLLANFESTLHDALEKLATGSREESLSSRPEFREWRQDRKPHDASVFMIGRELHAAIERVLPTEEQAGVDAAGMFAKFDSWMQLREYRSIEMDLDYEDADRALSLEARTRLRRPTRLQQAFGQEPGEFKLTRFVPAGAFVVMGARVADPPKYWESLVEYLRDMEMFLAPLMQAREEQWWDDEDMPGEFPLPPEPEPEPEPEREEQRQPGEIPDAPQGPVDKMLDELRRNLGQFGTSLDEIISLLGGEIMVCITPNPEIAKARAWGSVRMDNVFGTGTFGLALSLTDGDKARAWLERMREAAADELDVEPEPLEWEGLWGWRIPGAPAALAILDNTLLLAFAMEGNGEDLGLMGLRAMLDARTLTGPGRPNPQPGDFYMDFDIGRAAQITEQLNEELARRLDRYAEAPVAGDETEHMRGLRLTAWSSSTLRGDHYRIRMSGLPDFGAIIESTMGGGGMPAHYALQSYSQQNASLLYFTLQNSAQQGAESLSLDALLEAKTIRPGLLQLPFDSRWEGDPAKLGWTSLSMIERDAEGNLPPWVDAEAAAMIEANEKAGWRSLKLAEGAVIAWLKEQKGGFIVAYQEKPEMHGGHMVIYADGHVGWLHADVFARALELNAAGEPVPASGRSFDWPEDWPEEGPDMPMPEED
jgi:hypothetical protein